jgi:hypothetical protein
MRLRAGRPGLEIEILEPFDLGRVGYFLDLAIDDHAPPDLLYRIGAVDLKRRRPRAQALAKLRAQRRTEHDRLRLIIKRKVDRTDHCRRHAEGDSPNAAAGCGEQSNAPVPADLEEIDASVVRKRARTHSYIIHRLGRVAIASREAPSARA